MSNWKNKIYTGLVIGLISPPIAFYIFCLFTFRDEGAVDLLIGYAKRNVLTHVMSLSVLINLPLFFIFLKTNYEHSAKGIIGATLVYAFVIFILKLT